MILLLWVWIEVEAVEVVSERVCAVVAGCYPVRVDHGYYFEDE